MTNFQFLMRFLKYYDLLDNHYVIKKLKDISVGNIDISNDYYLFNFINHLGGWSSMIEGRLFWEIKHYQILKLFYELSTDKKDAKKRLQKQSYMLTGGFFNQIKDNQIWKEVIQFKNEILN